jgi:DnaD/phage-associated family protein
VDYAQKKLNKIFNTSELAKLWSFLDYLKLPTEVVMLVIEDCYNREKTGLRYITKVLNSFHDAGIDSYEKAEAYFVAKEEAVSFQRFVRRLFGLGERKLTRAEEETLSQWQGWAFSEEMLNLAYEKTVASAKNPSIAYMHRILESWHKQGFTSPAETEESRTASGGKAEKSFDSDDFFQAAVAKGLKNI